MKRLFAVFGNFVTLLFFIVAGWFLIRLVQNWSIPDTLQEPGVNSAFALTVSSTLTISTPGWETATLDQIHFGEPKVVLTDTHSLRIVQWVSDEELLILRGLNPGRSREAIEILNVQTNDKRFYGEISGAGKPVWLSNLQEVAFVDTDYETKKTVFSTGQMNGQSQKQSELELLPYLTVSSDGDTLLGFEAVGWPPILIDPLTNKSRALPFDWMEFMPPAKGPRRYYQASWNPHYAKVVFYNAHRLLIADLNSGKMTNVILEVDKTKQEHSIRWALDVQWSPNGNKLAVIATTGQLPNTFRWLLVYDIETDTIKKFDLPVGFGLNNLTWSPNSRFLLTQGDVGYIPPGYALQGVILIDIVTQNMNEINLLPEETLGEGFMVWSPNGEKVAFLCNRLKQDYKAICLSAVEVKK